LFGYSFRLTAFCWFLKLIALILSHYIVFNVLPALRLPLKDSLFIVATPVPPVNCFFRIIITLVNKGSKAD